MIVLNIITTMRVTYYQWKTTSSLQECHDSASFPTFLNLSGLTESATTTNIVFEPWMAWAKSAHHKRGWHYSKSQPWVLPTAISKRQECYKPPKQTKRESENNTNNDLRDKSMIIHHFMIRMTMDHEHPTPSPTTTMNEPMTKKWSYNWKNCPTENKVLQHGAKSMAISYPTRISQPRKVPQQK